MADLFSSEQGKRLFAYIAAGGSAGALTGPALTVLLVERLGAANLLLIAALFLEIAVLCVRQLESQNHSSQKTEPQKIGGGVLDGIIPALRSPYLFGIILWVSLLSVIATFLYFQQAGIVAAYSDDPAGRTPLLSTADPGGGHLTPLPQR